MQSNEIRAKFLEFFRARGHRIVRSSSLVPANDPTLLFSNAGMNQFKDVFLGRERRDYARACSSQKCVRAGGKHNDLEQVGRTRRHHTFFEMLGNFSFGDYFKKEAIPWAWELITKDFAIPRDRLYVTVFREDDEAEEIWARDVGVRRERIFRCDEKDNFWAMGDTGPCGPCSEIHYDLGPEASDLGHADCEFPCPQDCGRYVEIWNLVFMQFSRDEQGNLAPLPRPSIDTGAGLERLAAVLQGKISNFDTDLFKPLIDQAADLASVAYGDNQYVDVSLRIIADHARAATFLISDGVLPSNEGRGYVLRRIVRRALYHGQTMALNQPFLYEISSTVVDMMKTAYPELQDVAHHVAKAIKVEEERYAHTARIGAEKVNSAHVFLFEGTGQLAGQTLQFQEYKMVIPRLSTSPVGWVVGKDLFKLHDTFGLLPDIVEDIVRPYFLTVDRQGYETEMQRQRERAQASWKGDYISRIWAAADVSVYRELAERCPTTFYGYTETESHDCRIVGLLVKGQLVNEVAPGTEVEIVLDHTPFYAEAGGQIGDTGYFLAPDSDDHVAQIMDTYRPVTGLTAHKAVARERLHVGDVVEAQVDVSRRDAIRRNHTATHLLHAALRTTLGSHVKQAGSLVAPDRLRFDFTHYAALGEQDLLDIEDLVNEHILRNEEVVTALMDLDTAVNSGAMALFGEKYADQVRVLSIAGFSKELCGGTHVRRTGDIGLFKVVSEASVAAGTRRIEALTGTGTLEYLRKASGTLALLGNTLRAKPDELVEAAEKLEEAEKKARRRAEALQQRLATQDIDRFVSTAQKVKGVFVNAQRVEDGIDRAVMRQIAERITQARPGVIVLGTVADGKVALVASVSKDLTDRLDAGKLIRQVAQRVDGSGGGRKDLAEAGGKSPEKLDEALRAVAAIVEGML